MWNDILISAINQSIRLYKQPIISLHGNGEKRYEILLRVVVGDAVYTPQAILSAAKEQGWLCLLDNLIIDRLFELIQSNGYQEGEVYHVNLGSNTLEDGSIIQSIDTLLSSFQLSPKSICFELLETESVTSKAIQSCLDLRAIGCGLAIDDFGTGQTSFEHIEDLKPDFVKIAGRFVRRINEDSYSARVVSAINQCSKALGIMTIAESVEDMEIAETLENFEIDMGQGWFFDKPIEFEMGEYCAEPQ